MTTDNRDRNTESLLHQWKQGKLAQKPGFATIVLALVLLITLGGAWLLVRPHIPRYNALRNGAAIVASLKTQGVDRLLAAQPPRQFWLHETDGKILGFSALHLQPADGDTPNFYTGRELTVLEDGLWQSTFQVRSDLAAYRYDEPEQFTLRLGRRFAESQRVRIQLQNSTTTFTFILGPGLAKDLSLPLSPPDYVVPRFLVDLCSSLALESFPAQGAAFAIPDPALLSHQPDPYHVFWVQPTDDIPDDIQQHYPQGHAAAVHWLNTDHRQILFYDQSHRLVWQKDLYATPSIMRAVDRDTLLTEFPQARQILDQWEPTDEPSQPPQSTPDDPENKTGRTFL